MALKVIKNGKTAKADGVLPEFHKLLGSKGENWLFRLTAAVAKTCDILKLWQVAKVIAILKPDKPTNGPSNYRPISLMSTVYKLSERLLPIRL